MVSWKKVDKEREERGFSYSLRWMNEANSWMRVHSAVGSQRVCCWLPASNSVAASYDCPFPLTIISLVEAQVWNSDRPSSSRLSTAKPMRGAPKGTRPLLFTLHFEMHSGRRRTRQMRQSNYSLKRTESICKASYRKNALVFSLI